MAASKATYFTYATPHGPVTIAATSRGVSHVVFGDSKLEGTRQPSAITNEASTQLLEYFAGKRTSFDVPLDVDGTPFQKDVWYGISTIPYGTTISAADLADSLDKSGAHRSVGTAVKRNPAPPFIPSHRVLSPGASGKQAKIFRALVALEERVLGE